MPGLCFARTFFSELRLSRWADLRRADRLRHTEKDHHSLPSTEGRNDLIVLAVASSVVLPVVGHPNVTGRTDADVNLQLKAAADIAAGWRYRISCFHTGRAILSSDAAQLDDPGLALVKLETQMLSFPSTETAQGP